MDKVALLVCDRAHNGFRGWEEEILQPFIRKLLNFWLLSEISNSTNISLDQRHYIIET